MNAVMIPVLMQKFMNSEKNIDPEQGKQKKKYL